MQRRSRRLSTALLAIFALLISQLAVSAHICAIMDSAASTIQLEMASPCPDEGNSQNVCEQHCQFGHAAVDHAKPLPALDLTLGPALHIDHPYVFLSLERRSLRELPPPPEPPPAIRFSVLRI
jgi:hypothetical protein